MRNSLFISSCLIWLGCGNTDQNWVAHPVRLFSSSSAMTRHVLDPLSPEELQLASEVLRKAGLLGGDWYVQTLYTEEPDKTAEGLYPKWEENHRKAFAVVLNLANTDKLECIIDLETGQLESRLAITQGQPALLNIEQIRAKKAIVQDEQVMEAIRARGLEVKNLFVEPWAPGDLSQEPVNTSHRFIRGTLYYKEDSINPYGRPIEGINTLYDVTTGKVTLKEEKESRKIPLQTQAHDFFKASEQAQEAPDGFMNTHSNIQISGTEVTWKGWKLRFQLHPREGLVLYDVRRQNHGVYESILERAALSEMVVPYADPDKQWFWKSAFDQGEYGIGINTNTLMRGVHFPVTGLTFPAHFLSETGEMNVLEQAIAIYEKEAGILWSHYDWDTNTQAGRSGKELVILSFFTVGNYDYGLNWVFREDGSIDLQVFLTGVLLTKGSLKQKCGRCENLSLLAQGDQFGTVVDKNLVAIAHQHHFNFRLDFAVGGGLNSVAEIALKRTGPVPNPHGNAFLISEKLLKTEQEAVSQVDHQIAKHWWIFNKSRKNALGHYPGYLLDPGKTSGFFAQQTASVLNRAPFLKNNFYVTEFHPREMHAAGDYPSQSSGDGLPVWIASRNASIVQKDLVVWVTPVATHLPCAEEWPVMTLHRVGFGLRPMGFHEINPVTEGNGLLGSSSTKDEL